MSWAFLGVLSLFPLSSPTLGLLLHHLDSVLSLDFLLQSLSRVTGRVVFAHCYIDDSGFGYIQTVTAAIGALNKSQVALCEFGPVLERSFPNTLPFVKQEK